MEYDLMAIQKFLTQTGLMQRPICTFTQDEIEGFCQEVHRATTLSDAEYQLPFIKDGDLILPGNVHPRFKYWAGGQGLFETLEEMEAGPETIKRYCPSYIETANQ